METVRGMQLNFFPFFLCSGSVTRPRVSYMFKRNELPLRQYPCRFSVGPLDFVLRRRGLDSRESRSKPVLVYIMLYSVQISYQSRLWFKMAMFVIIFTFEWYFVEAQPGMIFYVIYLLNFCPFKYSKIYSFLCPVFYLFLYVLIYASWLFLCHFLGFFCSKIIKRTYGVFL